MNLTEEDIQHIIKSYKNEKPGIKQTVKQEISETEALQIYNELIGVLARHNVSYRLACDISVSLMYALLTGAAELYDAEQDV